MFYFPAIFRYSLISLSSMTFSGFGNFVYCFYKALVKFLLIETPAASCSLISFNQFASYIVQPLTKRLWHTPLCAFGFHFSSVWTLLALFILSCFFQTFFINDFWYLVFLSDVTTSLLSLMARDVTVIKQRIIIPDTLEDTHTHTRPQAVTQKTYKRNISRHESSRKENTKASVV